MKKMFLSMICIALVLSALGCANVEEALLESTPESSITEEHIFVESSSKLESVSWNVVSANPQDFGMESSLDNPIFAEVFNKPSEASLDKLIAFCLIADGLSEGASNELYCRFIEAPNTVLTFLSLLGDQTYALPGLGVVSIAEFTCKSIAFSDVIWYGTTTEFDEVIVEYRTYYPDGRIHALLDILEQEHNSAIESFPSN